MAKTKSSPKPERAKEQKKPYSMKLFFIFWGAILLCVAVGVLAFGLDPIAFVVWLLASGLSFAIVVTQLNQHWEGTIREIKTISEVRHSGDDSYTENVTYAFINLADGKTKKIRAARGWKAGDRLKKEKGEMDIKVL